MKSDEETFFSPIEKRNAYRFGLLYTVRFGLLYTVSVVVYTLLFGYPSLENLIGGGLGTALVLLPLLWSDLKNRPPPPPPSE